jgi:hypothetical protein
MGTDPQGGPGYYYSQDNYDQRRRENEYQHYRSHRFSLDTSRRDIK